MGNWRIQSLERHFEAHKDNKLRRLGPDFIEPKQVKYKKFAR